MSGMGIANGHERLVRAAGVLFGITLVTYPLALIWYSVSLILPFLGVAKAILPVMGAVGLTAPLGAGALLWRAKRSIGNRQAQLWAAVIWMLASFVWCFVAVFGA